MGMKKTQQRGHQKTAVWPIRVFRSLELFKVQKWNNLVLLSILALEKSWKDKKKLLKTLND